MSNSLFSKIKTYADEAPAAGFVNTNFGKLIVTPIVVSWSTDPDSGIRSVKKLPLQEGQELTKDEQLELSFKVMISELNPALTFEYERSVPIKNNGSQKTDWAEIVLPALEKTFGKNAWADAIEKQPYVAVEDVNNVAGRASSSGKVYGVPKITAKYASLDECKKARDLRYPKREEAGAAVAEEVDPNKPTEDAITQTRSLIESVGEAKARTMLKKNPFGAYDIDVLIALALNPDETAAE